MSLDGFSMSPLIAELDQKLAGGRIDNIFQPDKNTIVILIRQPGENYRLHIAVNAENPHVILSNHKIENPATPPVFCMVLRKHIEDGRIASITQHNIDRIVLLNIDVRGPGGIIISKTLVIEIMGKHSNAILTESDTIIDSIKRVGFNISRVRQVLPGKHYFFPPGQTKLNILRIEPEVIANNVAAQSGPLFKAIIKTAQGVGPLTAKEIAWRSGLPLNINTETLDAADIDSLSQAIASVTIPIREGNITPTVVLDTEDSLLGIAAFRLEHLADFHSNEFSTLSEAVEFAGKLSGRSFTKYTSPEKDVLRKLVTGEITRLGKKLVTISTEFDSAKNADFYRKCGDILMANLHIDCFASSKITLPDFYSESPDATIDIELDTDYSILENAQQYYVKYNKLKRAQASLTIQVEQSRQELAYLESIESSLDNAVNSADLLEVSHELSSAGYLKDIKKRRLPKQAKPLKIVISDNSEVLIGKNNYQNDQLTFKHARPNDFWFHTKDFPGSHIILRVKQQPPPDASLLLAAQFAAYFSKARFSSKIPVDYTQKKYVKKPFGSRPGFVIYSNQKTIYVTPDQTYIEKLIKEQEKG
ncbi:Rqc2 family fibronectin-binding protein [Dendrosporobacter sp. 1207_IL3150]|uniref:Rqc2 family fibronectin-binding protein n=1 Tax=Dendrosporobacter sp. 1207_IL3150 TaxID=3084054 RepID=UPI002FD8BAE2